MKTRYKYIHFEKESQPGKRPIYGCFNNKTDDHLGFVEWYSPWRTWVFTAYSEACVFNASCLGDVSHFLKQLGNSTKATP